MKARGSGQDAGTEPDLAPPFLTEEDALLSPTMKCLHQCEEIIVGEHQSKTVLHNWCLLRADIFQFSLRDQTHNGCMMSNGSFK